MIDEMMMMTMIIHITVTNFCPACTTLSMLNRKPGMLP